MSTNSMARRLSDYPWFRFHIARFVTYTAGMNDEQLGSHFRKALTSWMYDDYEALPDWIKVAADERIEKTTTYSVNAKQLHAVADNSPAIVSKPSISLSSSSSSEAKTKDQEREEVSIPKEGKKKRIRTAVADNPPSLEEVTAYIQGHQGLSGIDPNHFHAYYSANGWVQGSSRKPIVNWKAAVVTWSRNRQ